MDRQHIRNTYEWCREAAITVENGVTLTVDGTLLVNGTLRINGTLAG